MSRPSDPFPHVPNHPNDVDYAWFPEAELQVLLEVAKAARVCVEQSAADNPFVGYAFEALRDALARLEDVAKL